MIPFISCSGKAKLEGQNTDESSSGAAGEGAFTARRSRTF